MMIVDKLRKAILQSAVQGKLVPQDSNEESASILLEKIKAERAKLIKSGKIKKSKQEFGDIYRGEDGNWYETIGKTSKDITDEMPFDIPDSWRWVRLGSISDVILGQSPDGSTVNEAYQGIEFHQGKIFFGGTFLKKSTQYTSKPKKMVSSGTILLCVRAPVGIVNITERNICIGRGLAGINGILVSNWIIFYFMKAFKKLIDSKAVGTTFVAITGDIVNNLLFPLPPLEEQKRIVAKLEEIKSFIDKYDQTSKELDHLNEMTKKSILQSAVQGKLVPQDSNEESVSMLLEKIKAERAKLIKSGKIKKSKQEFGDIHKGEDGNWYETIGKTTKDITDEIPFDIPDSWRWVRLRDIGEIVGGGTPKTELKENWENGTIPWVTPADMKLATKYINSGERYITEIGLKNSSAILMPPNSIVYSSRAPIGYIAITNNSLCTNQGCKSVIPYNFSSTEIIYYFLIALTPEIKKRASGTTFKEISGSKFGETLIPLPPLEEQKLIVEKIKILFRYISELKGAENE